MYKEKVKELLAQGLKPKQIAEQLGCHIHTVYKARINQNHKTGESTRPLYRKWHRHSEKGSLFSWTQFKGWLFRQTHCYITGQPIDYSTPGSWHIDHIIPKSRGGAKTLDNMAVVCKYANLAKHDLTYDELIEKCKEILEHAGYNVTPNHETANATLKSSPNIECTA